MSSANRLREPMARLLNPSSSMMSLSSPSADDYIIDADYPIIAAIETYL